jgi:hypothetical protein
MPAKVLVDEVEEVEAGTLDEVLEALTDESYACFVANNTGTSTQVPYAKPDIALICLDKNIFRQSATELFEIVGSNFYKTIKFIVASGNVILGDEVERKDINDHHFLGTPFSIQNPINAVSLTLTVKE